VLARLARRRRAAAQNAAALTGDRDVDADLVAGRGVAAAAAVARRFRQANPSGALLDPGAGPALVLGRAGLPQGGDRLRVGEVCARSSDGGVPQLGLAGAIVVAPGAAVAKRLEVGAGPALVLGRAGLPQGGDRLRVGEVCARSSDGGVPQLGLAGAIVVAPGATVAERLEVGAGPALVLGRAGLPQGGDRLRVGEVCARSSDGGGPQLGLAGAIVVAPRRRRSRTPRGWRSRRQAAAGRRRCRRGRRGRGPPWRRWALRRRGGCRWCSGRQSSACRWRCERWPAGRMRLPTRSSRAEMPRWHACCCCRRARGSRRQVPPHWASGRETQVAGRQPLRVPPSAERGREGEGRGAVRRPPPWSASETERLP